MELGKMMSRQTVDLFFKRVMDILLGVAGFLVTTPIMLVVATCIKLEDGGPVLFVQTRTGKDGKLFSIYKFRSMKVDAKQQNEYGRGWESGVPDTFIFKEGNDKNPCITKVGGFIRRTSIDELPQFFNVVIGNMSLVGPRPEIPDITCYYSEEQKKRLRVKPGLTGWAQVNGRSLITNGEKMQMDCDYVDHRSIRMDIYILILTVKVVLTFRGAV
ncbi:sugar transferase [Listeria booriae]|nr:sugar transferase [Listeria booriae]